MDGPDELWLRGVVAQHIADLTDQIRQVLLDHERVRPQALLQIGLRDRTGPAGDEDFQELKGLGDKCSAWLPRRSSRTSVSSTKSLNETRMSATSYWTPSTMYSRDSRRT
jgi:hypothetical protein